MVSTSGAHGFSNGDMVWLEGIAGMPELNRRRYVVNGVTASTFELDVTTVGLGPWTSGGTAARIYTLGTPYVTADLARLKYVQSADTMTLTHPSYAPRTLTRTGHTSWTLTTTTFAPTQQPPTGAASDSPGSAYSYVVTAVSEETGEESVSSAVVTSADQTSTVSWTDATGAGSYNVYKAQERGVRLHRPRAGRVAGLHRHLDRARHVGSGRHRPRTRSTLPTSIPAARPITRAGSGMPAPTPSRRRSIRRPRPPSTT